MERRDTSSMKEIIIDLKQPKMTQNTLSLFQYGQTDWYYDIKSFELSLYTQQNKYSKIYLVEIIYDNNVKLTNYGVLNNQTKPAPTPNLIYYGYDDSTQTKTNYYKPNNPKITKKNKEI